MMANHLDFLALNLITIILRIFITNTEQLSHGSRGRGKQNKIVCISKGSDKEGTEKASDTRV